MSEPRPTELPDYDDLAASMQRAGMVQSPAEVHGFALGLGLAGLDEPRAAWADELYADLDPNDVLAAECRRALDGLFVDVVEHGVATPLQLALLLPAGVAADARRLEAVRDWCQGLLFGIGLGGESMAKRLSEPAADLLRDVGEIVRLDTADVSDSAENQSALIEIEEYLRVGVMLLRDELQRVDQGDES